MVEKTQTCSNCLVEKRSKTTKNISASEAVKVIKLLDLLEENDVVQQVFHNMVVSEDILEAMEN